MESSKPRHSTSDIRRHKHHDRWEWAKRHRTNHQHNRSPCRKPIRPLPETASRQDEAQIDGPCSNQLGSIKDAPGDKIQLLSEKVESLRDEMVAQEVELLFLSHGLHVQDDSKIFRPLDDMNAAISEIEYEIENMQSGREIEKEGITDALQSQVEIQHLQTTQLNARYGPSCSTYRPTANSKAKSRASLPNFGARRPSMTKLLARWLK